MRQVEEAGSSNPDSNQLVVEVSATNPFDLSRRLQSIKTKVGIRAVVVDLTGQLDDLPRNKELDGIVADFPIPLVLAAEGRVAGWAAGFLLDSHISYAGASAVIEFDQKTELTGYIAEPEIKASRRLIFSVEQAADLGIVNMIDEERPAIESARETAGRIARMAPLAIRACLKSMRNAKGTLEEGLQSEIILFSQLFDSKDTKKGINSFLDKTAPDFEGK